MHYLLMSSYPIQSLEYTKRREALHLPFEI
nr:MAG TPA: hypothetical protein [Bacteriophage sp.]